MKISRVLGDFISSFFSLLPDGEVGYCDELLAECILWFVVLLVSGVVKACLCWDIFESDCIFSVESTVKRKIRQSTRCGLSGQWPGEAFSHVSLTEHPHHWRWSTLTPYTRPSLCYVATLSTLQGQDLC